MVRQLGAYLLLYGDDGKTQLNIVCPKHSITLEAANIDRDISCDIKDGVFRILFREKWLGVNTATASVYNIADAVNAAPLPVGYGSGMSFTAKQSVKQKYDPEIEAVRSRVAGILQVPYIKLTPNFDQIFEEIKEVQRVRHTTSYWEEQLGRAGLSYFKDAFLTLLSSKFANDEYLCEAFREAVFENEVRLRIVNKLVRRDLFEAVIEDGVLYIQVR
jgi:hypothetical protein